METDGKLQIYVDYTELNKIIEPEIYKLPYIPALLDSISESKIFSEVCPLNIWESRILFKHISLANDWPSDNQKTNHRLLLLKIVIKDAFHQLTLEKKSRRKTAFSTGKFDFFGF